jgi:hypothetical protein
MDPVPSAVPASARHRLVPAAAAALPYPLALVAGTLALDARPADGRTRWLDYASTDLANLADHPVRAMLLSACFAEGNLLAWSLLALVGMGALGWRWGVWRPQVLVLAVHVLATLVSQGITAVRIAHGALPESARSAHDVGPSYVVVAALIGAVGYGTLVGRILAALGFGLLVPSLFGGLTSLDVAAVGHLASVVLALTLGRVLLRTRDPKGAGRDGVRGDGGRAGTRRPRLARRPPAPSANRGLEPRAR